MKQLMDTRVKALADMHKAALQLIKLIELEKRGGSGGDSWRSRCWIFERRGKARRLVKLVPR
jgi:hypothetical protein